MVYVVLYVANRSGVIEPVYINPLDKKEELKHIINSYVNIVRVAIEFVIGGKSFFKYNLSDIKNVEYIDFFKSYGGSTTTYNTPSMSTGFIDRLKKIRVEYMQDGIKVYQLR